MHRASIYHSNLQALLAKALGNVIEISQFESEPSILVTKSGLSAFINTAFGGSPITITGGYSYQTSQSVDLTVPVPAMDCAKLVTACQFKNTCQGDRCEQVERNVVHTTCRVSCCLSTGLIGCIIPGICNKACDIVTNVTKPIAGPTCDAFRAAGQIDPGLCAEAAVLDAGTCVTAGAAGLALCDTVNAVKKFYESHPFATLSMSVALRYLPYTLTVSNVDLDPTLAAMTVDANLGARGPIDLSVAYQRHLVASFTIPPPLNEGQCQVNWSSDYTYDGSVTASRSFQFTLSSEAVTDGSLLIRFVDDREFVVFADASPPPLEHLFATTPKLDLGCPALVFGSVVLGTLERTFTKEESRQLWPLLTGKHYPIKVKAVSLPLSIPPIAIEAAHGTVPVRTITPKLTTSGILFSPS
jgi:hypothetical protein